MLFDRLDHAYSSATSTLETSGKEFVFETTKIFFSEWMYPLM